MKNLARGREKNWCSEPIMKYGRRIGERVKRGLPDTPKYGVFETKKPVRTGNKSSIDNRAYDCVFARTFKEYGELDTGHLYCYVDAAKKMAVDPSKKLTHRDCVACGDDFCTFEVLPATEQERSDFEGKRGAWKNVDPRLAEGVRRR